MRLLCVKLLNDLSYHDQVPKTNNNGSAITVSQKWNVEKPKPSFSVRVTQPDTKFMVGPVTGFPHAYASFQQLNELQIERPFII